MAELKAINESGTVIGNALDYARGSYFGFVLQNGIITLLPGAPDGSLAAVAISATGKIIGQAQNVVYYYYRRGRSESEAGHA